MVAINSFTSDIVFRFYIFIWILYITVEIDFWFAIVIPSPIQVAFFAQPISLLQK